MISSIGKPWLNVAAELGTFLTEQRSGTRESMLSAFARQQGLALETIRNYWNAWRFLQKLAEEERDLAHALRATPVDSLLALSALYNVDSQYASNIASKLANAELTVREVRKLVRAARHGCEGEGARPRLLRLLRSCQGLYWGKEGLQTKFDALARYEREGKTKKWGQFVAETYSAGGDFYPVEGRISRNRRIDIFAGTVDFEMPIILVGPYNFPEYYSKRCIDWMLAAVAATKFYNRAALLFDETAYKAPFQRWLQMEDPMGSLEISLISIETDGTCRLIGREADEDIVEKAIGDGFPPMRQAPSR